MSARSTGSPLAIERAQASAVRNASRASATVHGLGVAPRATSTNAVSSVT